jgi:hypothetical protein
MQRPLSGHSDGDTPELPKPQTKKVLHRNLNTKNLSLSWAEIAII